MKHTKGPWKTEENSIASAHDLHGDNVWIGTIHKDHHTAGERPSQGFPGNDEAKANARLIAESPAMYDALKRLLSDVGDQQDSHSTTCCTCGRCLAFKVIAKIEGKE